MITEEQAMKLLVEANPVPDMSKSDLDDVVLTMRLVEPDMRSSEMTELKSKNPAASPAPERRRYLGVAAASAATIAIAGAILMVTRAATPVADTLSPVETALAFVEAFNGTFDIDEALSYLADPATSGLDPAGAADLHQLGRFLEATGGKLVDPSCVETNTSPDGTVVTCTYMTHDFFSDEMGLGPYGPHVDQFTVVEGKIASVAEDVAQSNTGFADPDGFSKQIWEPFAAWMRNRHPEDMNVMYGDSSARGWSITDESIPVWELRLREYVQEVTGRAEPNAEMGLVGLPPEGAVPSRPESVVNLDLVLSMWTGTADMRLYVYADGRFIWRHNATNTGYFERRATTEGVELLVSEVLASGLFEENSSLKIPKVNTCNQIEVVDSDQVVTLDYGFGECGVPRAEATPEQSETLLGLVDRLADPEAWLPESAWVDREPKIYVPAMFEVCYGAPVRSSLGALPSTAAELLGKADSMPDDADWYCTRLTTAEARTLVGELDDAGVERGQSPDRIELWYELTPEDWGVIEFFPVLPHGHAPCLSCG